jgi:hypothetical protein
MIHKGWIGVDLDGTLAHYDHWEGPMHIGEPIPKMVERVKSWLETGVDVRIFTARVARTSVQVNLPEGAKFFQFHLDIVKVIQDWAEKHLGKRLPVTCEKDFLMVSLWDDRCVQVVPNTGRPLAENYEQTTL